MTNTHTIESIEPQIGYVSVQPIESKDFPTLALRPPFSVLNKSKIKATFGLEIPHWRESLRACLVQL